MRTEIPSFPSRQQGIALVVSLVLLVVITLVGLAAIRGTRMQTKMAANQYDRQVGFQNASAALVVAQDALKNNTVTVDRHCYDGTFCAANPFTAPNLPANEIRTVPTTVYQAGATAVGQPQYVIEQVDQREVFVDPNDANDPDCYNTNNTCPRTTLTYYRITARSGDPDVSPGRAVVTLQAIVTQS